MYVNIFRLFLEYYLDYSFTIGKFQ